MRTQLAFLTLALLFAAPAALAQDKANEEYAPSSEDCPPDMFCASGSDETDGTPQPYGDESCIECSGPAPDDGTTDDTPQPYGNESCIECSGPPADGNGATCMDGQDQSETCMDDVQYLGGEPTRGPSDGSCENCRGETDGPTTTSAGGGDDADADVEAKAVPAGAVALIILGSAGALVLAGRRG